LTAGTKDLRAYLRDLDDSKEGRSEQVKEGLTIYIDLWKKAIQRGVVTESDRVDEALMKIEKKGGLYAAAGEERGPS